MIKILDLEPTKLSKAIETLKKKNIKSHNKEKRMQVLNFLNKLSKHIKSNK
jgi:hypothetical protein